MVLFIIISISTLLFSAYLIYYTYQIGSFSGATTVHGRIIDVSGDPIDNVLVTQDESETLSDIDGYWTLEGVDEGLITIRCYKRGFVPYETEWLAYPDEKRWVGDSPDDSPNNLSVYGDIELRREMTYISMDGELDGSLGIDLDLDPGLNLSGKTVRLTDGSDGESKSLQLDNGENTFTVREDGYFEVGLEDSANRVTGYHPLTGSIDITDSFEMMISTNSSIEWLSLNNFLNINLNYSFFPGSYDISLISDHYNHTVTINSEDPDGGAGSMGRNISLPPGIYEVEITGLEIRDIGFVNITMIEGENFLLNYDLDEGDVLVGYSQRSTNINYIYAIFYLIMAGAMIYGAIRITNEESTWAPLIILAFLGFFTRGPIDIYIFNINGVLSFILLILIIYIRRDMIKRK